MFDTIVYVPLTDRDDDLRRTVRSLLEGMADLPASRRARSWMGFDRDFSRRLGAAGLLGLGLPAEYGGADRGVMARFVVAEELLAVGAPVAAHWIADRQSAPLILRYGTPEQRRSLLPAIVSGESCFCIGMSEPGSGSDLASVRTRATQLPDGRWRVDGQKVWTTNAQHADFMVALVRTSGEPADRQRGLSQILIDLSLPGVTVKPITDSQGDAHFSEVFFDGVEVGGDALLGAEGEGWAQVTAELAFERSGPERIFSSMVLLDAWAAHLAGLGAVDPAREALLGRLTAEFAALRGFSIAVSARLAAGEQPTIEASLIKDLGTAFEQSVPALVADDLAARPDEPVDPQLSRTLVYLLNMAPTFSLRGGTREVLRGIIARGLGLR